MAAFAPGVRTFTVGRGPVVKLHLVVASALTPLLSVATYVVSAARVRVGFNVATRVLVL